jgi:hypothetical protein
MRINEKETKGRGCKLKDHQSLRKVKRKTSSGFLRVEEKNPKKKKYNGQSRWENEKRGIEQ